MPIKIIRKVKKPETPVSPAPRPASLPKQTPTRLLDGVCRTVIGMHPNAVVSWYLITSYLYYQHDMAIISDGLYDFLCQRIDARWDDCQKHPHGHLLDREAIKAGAGFQLRAEDYPTMVKGAARNLAQTELGVTIPIS